MTTNGSPLTAHSPITVSLRDLQNGSVSLSSLEEAFGPDSLGIIVVKDLPDRYVELRSRVLSYSSYLANLPREQLDQLESSKAKYLTGWSLGKEKLKSDRPDTFKGSYYINCAFYQDPSLQGSPDAPPPADPSHGKTYEDYPEYTTPNVWPSEQHLPGFREACVELCGLIIDVAVLVAGACDRFAMENVQGYEKGYLEKVVRTSMTTKARLLHYFPPTAAGIAQDGLSTGNNGADQENGDEDEDDWCATHCDHGCLTGLTSAMYIDEAMHDPTALTSSSTTPRTLPKPLAELPSAPDPHAGLYIHSRSGAITKISIPKDCLAFQTGEALQVITKGAFRAVPHYVKGLRNSGDGNGIKVARNTLAVFTQPNLWDVVDREKGVDFAGFARGVVEKNY